MTAERNDGAPAFPGWSENHYTDAHPRGGMTLRDYFAAKAMAVLTADLDIAWRSGNFEAIAQDAYAFADAMLAAREEA